MASTPRFLADDFEALRRLADVEILYTDLDGTLLAPGGTLLADGDGAPSVTAAEAVVAVNRAGLPVVVASGRSSAQLIVVARMCGWNDFIAEVGAVRSTWRDGQRITTYDTAEWPQEIPAPGATPLDAIYASGAFDALVSAFPGRVEHHDPWHLNRAATDVLRGCLPLDAAQAVLDDLALPIDLLDNGIVRRRPATLLCEGPLHAYHLVPRGVSKRRAIALDLIERGLAPEQAAVIGDSDTDLDCAPSVGLLVLVQNAFEVAELAERAARTDNAWVTRGRRGDGWAEFARLWVDARAT